MFFPAVPVQTLKDELEDFHPYFCNKGSENFLPAFPFSHISLFLWSARHWEVPEKRHNVGGALKVHRWNSCACDYNCCRRSDSFRLRILHQSWVFLDWRLHRCKQQELAWISEQCRFRIQTKEICQSDIWSGDRRLWSGLWETFYPEYDLVENWTRWFEGTNVHSSWTRICLSNHHPWSRLLYLQRKPWCNTNDNQVRGHKDS